MAKNMNGTNKTNLSKAVFTMVGGVAVAATLAAPAAQASQVVNHNGVDTLTGVQKTTQKISLPLPSKSYALTSAAGPRCMPVYAGGTVHYGQDLGAPEGTPIYAVADGTVTSVRNGNNDTAGSVTIKHVINGEVFYSVYVHMWTSNVSVGQNVKAGQKISTVGNSGASTGAHLHLEMWGADGRYSGKPIEPIGLLKAWGGPDMTAASFGNYNETPPSTCNYYTVSSVALKNGSGSNAKTVLTIPAGSKVVSRPGDATDAVDGMMRVKYGKTVGWIPQLQASPYKQGSVPASVGGAATKNLSGLPWGTVINSVIQVDGTTTTPAPSKAPVKSSPVVSETKVDSKPGKSISTDRTSSSKKIVKYTVVKNDSLYRIAMKHNTTVDAIQKANKIKGTTIYVGDVLNIPQASTAKAAKATTSKVSTSKVHTVVKNDNLYRIALNNNTTFQKIMKDNNLKNTTIYIGQKLIIK